VLASRTNSVGLFALFLFLAVGMAQAALVQTSCNRADYWNLIDTPAGQNNITISIVNDKCSYYGLAGTVYTNVTQTQSAGYGITFANFSQMLNLAGLGSQINLTVEYYDGSAWILLQNDSVSSPITTSNFSWTSGEMKQFRSNYAIASTFQSTAKFNVSNTMNFTPIASNGYELEVTDSVSPLSTINYAGAAGTTGPILVTYNESGVAPFFWHTTDNVSAFGPEAEGFNISYPGSCAARFAAAPTDFNTTNKSAVAGWLYCFPVAVGATTVGYTMVKVTNVTTPGGAPGSNLVGIKTMMTATAVTIIAESDPTFDTSLHNLTVIVNGTTGLPVEFQNVSIYNSTGLLYATNVTDVNGTVIFSDIPSENYTVYGHNSTIAEYNVSSVSTLNGTGNNPTVILSGYADTPTLNVTGMANATSTRYESTVAVNIALLAAGGFAANTNCNVTVGGASTSQITRSGNWCNGSITVPNTLDGNRTLNASDWDVAGRVGHNASFVLSIDNTHYAANTSTVNVTHNQSYVTLTNGSVNMTVLLPSNSNATYLNISSYRVANATMINATINVSVVANSTASFITGTVSVEFPVNLTVYGPTTWDGNIQLPIIKATTTESVSADTGYTSATHAVVELGVSGETLTFSKAVRILLPGMAGKLAAFVNSAGTTKITRSCDGDTQAVGDALAAGTECKRDVGSDLVIWTKHFTKFVAYNQTVNPPSPSYTYTTVTTTPTPSPSPTPTASTTPSAAPIQTTPIVQSTATPTPTVGATPTETLGANPAATTNPDGSNPTPAAYTATTQSQGIDMTWVIGFVVVVLVGAAAALLLRKPPEAPLPIEPPE